MLILRELAVAGDMRAHVRSISCSGATFHVGRGSIGVVGHLIVVPIGVVRR